MPIPTPAFRHRPNCACHTTALTCDTPEATTTAALRLAAQRAAFGGEPGRRRIIQAIGATTFAAAFDRACPILHIQEALAQPAPVPEKKDLKVGFIAITCATPIIMAAPMGFYAKNGLNVDVIRTAGWAVVRDKSLNGEYDAAHMLSPMPLALTMGIGANATPWAVAAIENINGQAITLANKHKDNRDPKNWKGFKFGIPFDYSMHAYLLRYYLAEAGLDPDNDVQLRIIPRPRWSPISAPRTSTASSARTPSISAPCSTVSASSTSSPANSGTAIPAAPSPCPKGWSPKPPTRSKPS